ncbi:MAG: hypothetical protein KBF98_12790, partial [Rhodoferax sp.]|nr:hypothetical protein [Rhodoferax sp.]
EAIDRIQQAAGGLDDRISEIQAQGATLNQLDAKLSELTTYLMTAIDRVRPAVVVSLETV